LLPTVAFLGGFATLAPYGRKRPSGRRRAGRLAVKTANAPLPPSSLRAMWLPSVAKLGGFAPLLPTVAPPHTLARSRPRLRRRGAPLASTARSRTFGSAPTLAR